MRTARLLREGVSEGITAAATMAQTLSKAVFHIFTQLDLLTVNQMVDKANPEGKDPTARVPGCL